MKEKFIVNLTTLSEGVSGNQILVDVSYQNENTKVILDPGWAYTKEIEEQRMIVSPEKVDAIILTHAHNDHVALVPLYIKNGYKRYLDAKTTTKIYCTNSTGKILSSILMDSYKVQKSTIKNLKSKISPIFSERDIENSLKLLKMCNYEEKILIKDNIELYFFRNAHIPGSSCVLLRVRKMHLKYEAENEYINFFFTGDTKKENFLQERSYIPEWVKNLPVNIITESTYANKLPYRKECFEKNITEAVKERKKIIIPVLALGRGQIILYKIKQMQEAGKIPENYKIYMDGKLFHKISGKYERLEEVVIKDFYPKNLIHVEKEDRRNILLTNEPVIVISTSGNGSFGPSNTYIQNCVTNKNVLLHFTSFQPEGTLGRKLISAKKDEEIVINGGIKKICADIKMSSEFSAHSNVDELISFFRSFNNVLSVLVTHGEQEARNILVKKILTDPFIRVRDAVNFSKQNRIIINEWGIQKITNSKL